MTERPHYRKVPPWEVLVTLPSDELVAIKHHARIGIADIEVSIAHEQASGGKNPDWYSKAETARLFRQRGVEQVDAILAERRYPKMEALADAVCVWLEAQDEHHWSRLIDAAEAYREAVGR